MDRINGLALKKDRHAPSRKSGVIDKGPNIRSVHRDCGTGLLRMIRVVQNIHTLTFILIAATLEVSGDAVSRIGIYKHVGLARIALMATGATLLFGYGFSINLAPLEFGQVVGLYITTLFIIWQVMEARIFFKVAHSQQIALTESL
jgi:small multidrug resistance family-3 protein